MRASRRETFAQALADHPSVNVGLHSVQPAALSLTQMTELGTVYRPADLKRAVRARARARPQGADGRCALRQRGRLPRLPSGRHHLARRRRRAVLRRDQERRPRRRSGGVLRHHPGARLRAAAQARRAPVLQVPLRRRAAARVRRERPVEAQCRAHQRPRAACGRAPPRATCCTRSRGTRCSSSSESSGAQQLRAAGFEFYDWGPPHNGEARLVVSWDQPEADVDALCAALASPLVPPGPTAPAGWSSPASARRGSPAGSRRPCR